ncbi:hypothetical protein ABZP36_011276 [Zizania latifolia]
MEEHRLGGGERPPIPTAARRPVLARHASFVRSPAKPNITMSGTERTFESMGAEYIPIVLSRGCSDIGSRHTMEDVYICHDNFMQDFGLDGPSAFYVVFDGHGGKHAADFVCRNLPRFIIEDEAFLQTNAAFAYACSVNSSLASGMTALAALVVGRSLLVANAGDCRAVLCCHGKAIEMSRDHRSSCNREKVCIEASGGYVYDDRLNGQLNVAWAIGDWHMEGLKACNGLGSLSAEPEVMISNLTEDEFLIIGCDGIWDVFCSQNVVDSARRNLQEHDDPFACCKELVNEAIKRKSLANHSVVVVCFNSRPLPVLTATRLRVQRSISAEGLRELQSFLDSSDD